MFKPVEVLTFSGFYTQLLKFALITRMIIAHLIIFNSVTYYKHTVFHHARETFLLFGVEIWRLFQCSVCAGAEGKKCMAAGYLEM